MSKADLSLNGLVGAVETVVESARRLQELEEHYQANEASFGAIRQQFQQIQESATQLQSLTEERLADLITLNVELKARHASGEQTLDEVKAWLDKLKAQQAKTEQE